MLLSEPHGLVFALITKTRACTIAAQREVGGNKCSERLIESGALFDLVFPSALVRPYHSPSGFPVCLCWSDGAFIYSGAGEEQRSDPYLLSTRFPGMFYFQTRKLHFVVSDKASVITQSPLASALKSLAEKLIQGQIFSRANIKEI